MCLSGFYPLRPNSDGQCDGNATATEGTTATQRYGNSDDGDDDSDEDGGDGWHGGDGRRYGDTTEMAAMGGATAHN